MTHGGWIPLDWGALHVVGVPQRGGFNVLETGVRVPAGAVLMALDAQRSYHLLVPLAEHEEVRPDTRSAGVHIVARRLEEGDQTTDFLDVVCRKPHLDEIFVRLVHDILQELDRSQTPTAAVCRRVLARWRELLESETPRVLTAEVLGGLYGELWHVLELVLRNSASIAAWAGPSGARHDFLRGRTALEVKVSLQRQGWFFEVHGAEQLQVPNGGVLYLSAMKLERSAAGQSVPELADAIIAAGANPRDLLERMAGCGYDARDAAYYRTVRFSVNSTRLYAVDEGFPRIIPASFETGAVPPGVLRIVYTIDLTGSHPAPLPEIALTALHGQLSEEDAA